MATRTSLLRCLTVALVAGFALSLLPAAQADEDVGPRPTRVRAPVRVHTTAPAPRVRTVVHVRTVERVRTRTRVVCYDYTGQPFDCRTPAPVAEPAPQPVIVQPAYSGCGGCAPVTTTCDPCAPAVAVPQYYSAGCGSCSSGYGYGGYGAYYAGYGGYAPYYRAAPYRWAVRTARYYHGGYGWRGYGWRGRY